MYRDIRWLVPIALFLALSIYSSVPLFWILTGVLVVGYILNRWGRIRMRWLVAGFILLVAGFAGIIYLDFAQRTGQSPFDALQKWTRHEPDANDKFLDSYQGVVREWEMKNPPLSFDDLNRLAKIEVEMADKGKAAMESAKMFSTAQTQRWLDLNARYVHILKKFEQN